MIWLNVVLVSVSSQAQTSVLCLIVLQRLFDHLLDLYLEHHQSSPTAQRHLGHHHLDPFGEVSVVPSVFAMLVLEDTRVH